MNQSQEEALAGIRKKVKELLVTNLSFLDEMNPEEIKDDEVLFGEVLVLDSLYAVEIVVLLQRHFNLQVKDMKEGREIFQTIDTLSRYIYENTQGQKK